MFMKMSFVSLVGINRKTHNAAQELAAPNHWQLACAIGAMISFKELTIKEIIARNPWLAGDVQL